MNQQNDALKPHPRAFKCEGKISEVVTHTNGPKPGNHRNEDRIVYQWYQIAIADHNQLDISC